MGPTSSSSSTSTSTSSSSLISSLGMVECPICNKSVRAIEINAHIDRNCEEEKISTTIDPSALTQASIYLKPINFVDIQTTTTTTTPAPTITTNTSSSSTSSSSSSTTTTTNPISASNLQLKRGIKRKKVDFSSIQKDIRIEVSTSSKKHKKPMQSLQKLVTSKNASANLIMSNSKISTKPSTGAISTTINISTTTSGSKKKSKLKRLNHIIQRDMENEIEKYFKIMEEDSAIIMSFDSHPNVLEKSRPRYII